MDSTESHENFTSKYNLTFPLVADTAGLLVSTFGVWKDKSANSIVRSTFVLDTQGITLKVWESVDPIVHSQQVYEFLQSVQKESDVK